MEPTFEQDAARSLFMGGGHLAVEALAGTGKTSTLRLMAEATPDRGVYLAFNRSIVADSAGKMPENIDASTVHSRAMRAVGGPYRRRLEQPRMRSGRVASILGISGLPVRYGSETKVLQPAFLAGLILRAVRNFCASADPAPSADHFPYIDGIDPPEAGVGRTFANNLAVRAHLAPFLAAAWADLSVPSGGLPFGHPVYLKIWALTYPHIAADFLLVDESQDLSGVMLQVVEAQDHAQRVLVGDAYQSIYGWAGSVNAFGRTDLFDATATLTHSFRFGPEIAGIANGLLALLGADLRVEGHDPVPSLVAPLRAPGCVLCRTNAKAVATVLDAQAAGRRPHLIGGGDEVLRFVRAAKELIDRGWTGHPDLACFTSWPQVQEYVKADPAGEDLALLARLIDDFGVDAILRSLERMPSEGDADVVVSTVHKCVHPDTLVETPLGLVPIAAVPEVGVIATPAGEERYCEKVVLPEGPALEVSTSSGYSLTVTPEHGLTAWRDGRHARVAASDLRPGDWLRLRLGSTVATVGLASLPPPPARGDVRERRYPLPRLVDEDVAEFLGLMVADGTVYPAGFRLLKRYASVVERFGDLCRKLFDVEPHRCATDGTAGYEVHSRFLSRWLLSVGGLAPRAKAAPSCVLRSPPRVQAAFLRGLWEDGTVNESDGRVDHVHWETAFPDLGRTVQTMLLRQGLISRLTRRRSQRGITSVALFGQEARKFAERVGFVADEKNARTAGAAYGRQSRYLIPLSLAEVDALRPALHGSAPGNARRSGGLSRDTIRRAIAALGADTPAGVADRLSWHYERVETIAETTCAAVCVAVPGSGRFLQNGFDGWNSKGREWTTVQLADDFPELVDASPEELRLLYVAVTRAQNVLDLSRCPLGEGAEPERAVLG